MSFRYGYNMECGQCHGITALSASVYYREQGNSARVKCWHCPADIHFGKGPMALRDANDPVLEYQAAVNAAWYHTSTDPRWPRRGREMTPAQVASLRRLTGTAAEGIREASETQALHLGTYEAAVESMLRKMRDEDMAGETFWLYRVALRRDAAIEPGYRKETIDEAAQITQANLGAHDAIRYLNTWESPGSVSLAVRPGSLAAVQGIEVPVTTLGEAAAPALLLKVTRIRNRISQIQDARRDEPSQMERLRQRRAARHGGSLERSPTHEQHRLLEEISKLISCHYLPGISLTVREQFSSAMSAWAREQEPTVSDTAFIERFASLAMILTGPADVQLALVAVERREP